MSYGNSEGARTIIGEARFGEAAERAGLILDIRRAWKEVDTIQKRGRDSDELERRELMNMDEHIRDAKRSLVAAVAALGIGWTPHS